jgi:hypothetical protein
MASTEWRDEQGRKISDPAKQYARPVRDDADAPQRVAEAQAKAVVSKVNKTHRGRPVDAVAALLAAELARNVNGFNKAQNAGYIREWAEKISSGDLY